MDPFLDLITLLRPQATLWSGIYAAGKWGVSFRKHDDLLFCWVEAGKCQLIRPRIKPLHLHPGDFVLIRTTTPFTLASDSSIQPVDSEDTITATKDFTLRFTKGKRPTSIVRGGKFVFDSADEQLLTSLLPPLIHIASNSTSARRVQTLLAMNAEEAATPKAGGQFVMARLMEVLLIDLLRDQSLHPGLEQKGLLAGLSNPVTAVALRAMHKNVAHDWTVAQLAHRAGVSRSKFAAHFQQSLGTSPIQYLLDWRMAIAKDELRQHTRSLSEIAFAIGFQSVSAFSTAFTRRVGIQPSRYAASVR
jgi:AraC-like DNA-binding protein